MSAKSNDTGRAYEYAWINVLSESLSESRKIQILHNSSLEANKKAWNKMSKDVQEMLRVSANSAIHSIIELEPLLSEDGGDILLLEAQKDQKGKRGDVRDIVIKRDTIQWEIGLSVKHNHEAIKHSRLSHKLDFGKEWFDIPCSDEYWSEVRPIFDTLKQEKVKGIKWCELPDKEEKIYIPLLNGFISEIWRSYKQNLSMPKLMIEYLIGSKDYYKVVSNDNKRITIIHTFNVHKTLNMASKSKVSAISVPILDLPTELIAIKYKKDSNNTIEMYLNNGWQLAFRIHNASTFVEPSLKFDIQFIGMPLSVMNIECRWD